MIDYVYGDGTIRGRAHTLTVHVEDNAFSKQHTVSPLPEKVNELRVRLQMQLADRLTVDSFKFTAWPDPRLRLKHGPPLNLNRAGIEKLNLLPGVGTTTARRIADHRRIHGPFREIEGLLEVKGIGPHTLSRLRPFVTVSNKSNGSGD